MLENINFSYIVSENQKDLFTPNHIRYNVEIEYLDKAYAFEYQCNPNYMPPTKEDCLVSLLLDADVYENTNDEFEFADEYGYSDIKVAKAIYKACKKTYKAINDIFGNNIEKLKIELEDWF